MSDINPSNGSHFLWSRPPADRSPSGPTSSFIPIRHVDVEQSIPQRFEQQVAQHPDRIAVRGRKSSITYGSLNSFANRVARAILSLCGEGEEQTVGLLLEKDASLVAAIMGVLKAGHIYVPLDPAHPPLRASKMLDDSRAKLVITDTQNNAAAKEFEHDSRRLINIDELGPNLCEENIGLSLSPDTLAYIIYTSGSTGEPKGVVQNHRNVLHNIMKHTNSLQISSDDRLTWLASVSTGQAVTDIYCSLLNGATLCPFNLKEEGLIRLVDRLEREKISIYHSSASIFRHLLDAMSGRPEFQNVRVVKLGSEQVFKKDVDLWKKHFSVNCIFVNALSSTETGMMRELVIDKETNLARNVVPVGYPVDDAEVFLLDEAGGKVAHNTLGEITIKSRYLAPGYWGKPEITSAKFLPDPDGGDSRICLTGDFGRISPDGCLEYLGRKDHQVKIRGFRVEVAEVEAALLESCQLNHAVVLASEAKPGVTRLKAFVVPEKGSSLSREAIRTVLKKSLPDHMIPSEFVILDALPLTSSGKVDFQILKSNPSSKPEQSATKDLRSTLELQITKVWEELLGVSPIGVQEDFFALGGDSLLAVRMIDRLEDSLGIRFPLAALYSEATVENLARTLIDENRDKFRSPVVPLKQEGSRPPFYFLHGDYRGGGFFCPKLAQHLGGETPFYAILPHGLDGGAIPRTIEEMAADRLKALLDYQPTGPYVLGGHCNGGMVAFEMARQMQRKGLKVELLLIVDTSALNTRHRRLRNFIRLVGSVARLNQNKQTELFLSVRRAIVRWQKSTHGGMRGQVLFFREEMSRFMGKLITISKSRPQVEPSVDGNSDNLKKDLTYHLALEGYVPGPYPGRIVFFRTDPMQSRSPDDETVGWRDVTSQLEVCPIPGGHLTCLTEQFEPLAKSLSLYIRKGSRPNP